MTYLASVSSRLTLTSICGLRLCLEFILGSLSPSHSFNVHFAALLWLLCVATIFARPEGIFLYDSHSPSLSLSSLSPSLSLCFFDVFHFSTALLSI